MTKFLRLGSRGSKLALKQAKAAKQALAVIMGESFPIDVQVISTTGDKNRRPLSEIGGKSVFVKELEYALLNRAIDIAVHSLKDLPSLIPEGLALAGALPRAAVHDVLICREPKWKSLADLPKKARVGTGSPRRIMQLRAVRSDLIAAPIRGNIDTRLQKMAEGEYDAIILAAAGLERLHMDIGYALPIEQFLPAATQGIIGLECREADKDICKLLRDISDPVTWYQAMLERRLLQLIEGNCQTPVASYATIDLRAKEFTITSMLARDVSSAPVSSFREGRIAQAEEILVEMAQELIEGSGYQPDYRP